MQKNSRNQVIVVSVFNSSWLRNTDALVQFFVFVLFLPMCGSRKHPYPRPGGSMEIFSGEGGGESKGPCLEEKFNLKVNFQSGGED